MTRNSNYSVPLAENNINDDGNGNDHNNDVHGDNDYAAVDDGDEGYVRNYEDDDYGNDDGDVSGEDDENDGDGDDDDDDGDAFATKRSSAVEATGKTNTGAGGKRYKRNKPTYSRAVKR